MSRLDHLNNKIVDWAEAQKRIGIWNWQGLKVVFTNGCFDLLHKGHGTDLTQAADLGNRWIVGLNTDASVKRQGKDANRPVNDEQARATVLAALSVVDLVVLFDQDTPQELIELLQPNVVAKGADYDPEETNPQAKTYIVGKDIMDRIGGEVAAIPLVEGYSTTKIIERTAKR